MCVLFATLLPHAVIYSNTCGVFGIVGLTGSKNDALVQVERNAQADLPLWLCETLYKHNLATVHRPNFLGERYTAHACISRKKNAITLSMTTCSLNPALQDSAPPYCRGCRRKLEGQMLVLLFRSQPVLYNVRSCSLPVFPVTLFKPQCPDWTAATALLARLSDKMGLFAGKLQMWQLPRQFLVLFERGLRSWQSLP